MPFQIALSGLNAASADLEVTGNNIANASTTGFKSSRAEFVDVYADAFTGITSTSIGDGVRLAHVAQEFNQGNIDFTENSLDVAINGQGFYILSETAGTRAFSRNGSFHIDRQGFVVNNTNDRLQVYPAITGGTGFNTGVIQDLQLSLGNGPPQATTQVNLGLNLPSTATPPLVPFDILNPNNPLSFNHTTSATIYDSLGGAHLGTYYYVKDPALNTWDTYFFIDGNYVDGPDQLQFSNTGLLVSPATGQIASPAYDPANGAALMTVTTDYTASTQYGGPFGVNTLTQDGFASGRLTGLDIDPTGVIFARFTNGQSTPLAKMALANFPNLQGLRRLGDTKWGESFSSGGAIIGEAQTGSFGSLQSGALEASNVDLTEQLVQMITAQRNFQANAQMLSTADAITQTIINIR